MKKPLLSILLTSSLVWLITGCGDDPKPKKKPSPGFHTNRALFYNVPDKKAPNKEIRNALMDEFIEKSDIQCQKYLNDPIMRASSPNTSKSQLYANMFDNVSELVGTKGITDGAKGLYSRGEKKDPYKMQMAYERALSPEIMRGVEIARERYAQKILSNKYRLIESYTIPMLERDMESYDRLCNYETGLIEINRILKEATRPQKSMSPFSSKRMIDPNTIRNKVEAVNKEAEAKTKKRPKKKKVKQKPAKEPVSVTNENTDTSADIWNTIENNATKQESKEINVKSPEMSVSVFPDQESNETVSQDMKSLDI